MKKSKFLVWALAGASLALGACSSDDVVEGVGNVGVAPGEVGYMSLNINLPQQPRAARANDKFDDGVQAEYKVQNGKLLLFEGTDADQAKLTQIHDLAVNPFLVGSNTDQITSSATLVQKVTRPSGNNKLYALVVLNDNGLIDVTAKKFNNVDISNKTVADLQGMVLTTTAAALTAKGFFMTNAPLYTHPGGSSNPTGTTKAPTGGAVNVLAPIDGSKIALTPNEASTKPATFVYVERAVAKVTVAKGNQYDSQLANPNVASITLNGWALDNTNNKSFVVRNTTTANNWWGMKAVKVNDYRFVGGLTVKSAKDSDQYGKYRTYFAVDPNYDKYVAGDFTVVNNGVPTAVKQAGEDDYCLENTFDLKNQKDQSTTRVIVQAKVAMNNNVAVETDGTFYTLYGNTNTIYTKEGIIGKVREVAMTWLDQHKKEYFQGNYTLTTDFFVVNIEDKAGYVPVTVTVPAQLPQDCNWVTGKDAAALNAAVKSEIDAKFPVPTVDKPDNKGIGCYKGGVSYYPVKIKHFGDDLTPWDKADAVNGSSYPGEIGSDGINSADANWLGRYGVLRNNWYKIDVNSIKNIGEPSIPPVTDQYNDPAESYISAEINVLSWAVRNQSVDL